MPAAPKLNVDTTEDAVSYLPFRLQLELAVDDPETIAELHALDEDGEREQYALKALRIGVLALRQARGEVDVERVRRESDRLLTALDHKLSEHSRGIHDRLTGVLKDYFDPQDGRFQERVDRLIRRDGELEQVLRRQIGCDDSEMVKTLAAHIGGDSQLMKLLSPDQSQGLLAALRETLDGQLTLQREHVLHQFSLDNKEGALARFISELTDRQGELSQKLHGKLDEVVKEFSLDEEDSALNRLVKNVERAQRTITSEFSLDDDQSALSRLKLMLEQTNSVIHSHLSLDDETSALARLKRELLTLLSDHRETNQKFQEEVKGALQAMVARRQEAERSTRHGLEFEDAVFEYLQREAQRAGDIATHTGNTTGRIRGCKVGDCLIELGPECAAPGARIVIEAKEKAGYTFSTSREEISTARDNREAQIGVFVFSKRTAPAGLEPLARYGDDVFVVWDAEDTASDLYLRVGITLARALCVRAHNRRHEAEVDFSEIDRAINELQAQAGKLDEIDTWANTIKNNSDKIRKHVTKIRKSLADQAELLHDKTEALKQLMDTAD